MIRKINVEIAQYLMRQAFEEGFRLADNDRGQSSINPQKGKWFDYWLSSQTRATLVANGVISGKEDFR